MKTAKYLLAKYVPDLRRVEPRNIGVVLWSPAGVEARFVGEKPGRPGEVDGRSIPSYVRSPAAFKQWITFWRAELEKNEIAPITGGASVARSSPGFLKVLEGTSKGQFVLTEGGILLDPISEDELPQVVDHLYADLVEATPAEESRDPTLDEICDNLILETGLQNDLNFRSRFEVRCSIDGNTFERFQFSHAYQNGTLQKLYQRVPISKKKTNLRKTVHDSAWMFEKVIAAGIIQRGQGAVLVHAPSESGADEDIAQSLRVLGSVTRVLNVADAGPVRAEFAELAQQSTHHAAEIQAGTRA